MEPERTQYDRPKPQVGNLVTFRIAAKVVQFRPNEFVEVIDEDGHTHEVPAFALQSANEKTVARFEKKEFKRLKPQLTSPPPSAAPRTPAPDRAHTDDRPREFTHDQSRRHTDDRRERIERRRQKERGY